MHFSDADLFMKRSASKTITCKNGNFNLERLSCFFRLAWQGISTLGRLWNGFVSALFQTPNFSCAELNA